ncbi:hypothetical protein EV1_040104 [Malus domestica]
MGSYGEDENGLFGGGPLLFLPSPSPQLKSMAIWQMRDTRSTPPTYNASLSHLSASKPSWSILPATSPSSPPTLSSATPPTSPSGSTPSSPSSTIRPSCPSHPGLSQKTTAENGIIPVSRIQRGRSC